VRDGVSAHPMMFTENVSGADHPTETGSCARSRHSEMEARCGLAQWGSLSVEESC
jgi:hypothetical protein